MKGGGGQLTGPNGATLISPSQIKQTLGEACWARWGYARLDKIREPSTPAMEKGTARHTEMENWAKFGVTPKSKAALKALRMTRLPIGVCEIEVTVRFDTENVCWWGFIDAAYDWVGTFGGDGRVVPIGEGDFTVIHDWKFTGNLSNAKSVEELQHDPAAVIYCYEAYLGGAKMVWGRWVYVEMDGKHPSGREVWFPMKWEHVSFQMGLLDIAGQRQNEKRSLYEKKKLRVIDLDRNPARCNDYRRACHYMQTGDCKPPSRKSLFSLRGADMTTNPFMKDMENFPGNGAAKKAPPPLPGRKPPALPPKKTEELPEALKNQRTDAEIGVPERGFINPPEAPEKAAANPEEAAAQQGIEKPKPAEPDTYDAMGKDELIAEGLRLGLDWTGKNKPRNREPALRDMLRIHVRSLPESELISAAEAQGQVTPLEEDFSTDEGACKALADACTAIFEKGFVERVLVKEEKGVLVEHQGITFMTYNDIMASYKKTPTEEVMESPAEEEPEGLGLTLYLNADITIRPSKMIVTQQSFIVREAESRMGVPDYRLVDYGKGRGELACAVREMIAEGIFVSGESIILDGKSEAGAILADVFFPHAALVVRGF